MVNFNKQNLLIPTIFSILLPRKLFGWALLKQPESHTSMEIIFWDFLIHYQIFVSPQVKQSVIISNKHCIYGLPQELPNDLRLLGS